MVPYRTVMEYYLKVVLVLLLLSLQYYVRSSTRTRTRTTRTYRYVNAFYHLKGLLPVRTRTSTVLVQ